jgi:pimeloyl-ACP methyl ester carboxylesterase
MRYASLAMQAMNRPDRHGPRPLGLTIAGGLEVVAREWCPGGRPTVLAWHGLGDDVETYFDGLGPRLASGSVRSIAIQAPGFGVGPRPRRLPAAPDVAARCAEALGGAVVFVGLSWGGAVGVELAARRPELVRGLVLLDGGYVEPRDSVPGGRAPLLWPLVLSRLVSRSLRSPHVPVSEARAAARARPTARLERLERSGVPVLLLHATRGLDPVREMALRRFSELLPSATLVGVPDAGHGVAEDAPGFVADAIGSWFRGQALS